MKLKLLLVLCLSLLLSACWLGGPMAYVQFINDNTLYSDYTMMFFVDDMFKASLKYRQYHIAVGGADLHDFMAYVGSRAIGKKSIYLRPGKHYDWAP